MIISLVICTYNRDKYLAECLESITKLESKKEDFEIIVINNNSSDDTDVVCESFKSNHPEISFRYELELNQGLSYARNRGIDISQGIYIAFIDDDAILDIQYLKNLISFVTTNSNVSVMGGKIIPYFETGKPKWISRYLLPLFATLDLGNKVRVFPREKFPVGANMIFKKSIFEISGRFNVNLGRKEKNLEGGEEKDIISRMRLRGEKVYYLPDVVILHQIPGYRTTKDYIIKQAIGIGKSEKIRTKSTKNINFYHKRIFFELIKWGLTLVLTFFYFLTFQFSKGVMLFKFRYFISKNLFLTNE